MIRTALSAALLFATTVSNATESNSADKPAVRAHLDAARAAAGTRWADKVEGLCRLGAPERRDPTADAKLPRTLPEVPNWPEAPKRIFDNLYFVGSKGVSSFALVTSAGIIITDAMWAYDVERSVVGGLKSLGLDPAAIRYVIIPHGHPDHYGGAQLLHDRYGAKIVAPRGDLDFIKEMAGRDTTPVPKNYDVLIGDGDQLTLGDTTVNFHLMPGHTPGGVVMSFPVKDGGKEHRMLIWAAGGATPDTSAKLQVQMPALRNLINTAKATGIDAIAENHGSHELLQTMTANPQAGNLFLVGAQAVTDYLTMRLECDGARLAAQEDPPEASQHVAAAMALAKQDLIEEGEEMCRAPTSMPPRAPTTQRAAGLRGSTPVEPTEVFDNIYYLGREEIGSWAVTTSEGIILIDAMNNASDVEEAVIGGAKKLGLDPATIKYVVITHDHGDHYGGAQYLKDRVGARLIMGEPDWNGPGQKSGPPGWVQIGPKPKRDAKDLGVVDYRELTLGDTTIRLVVTPGHTPGTLSVLFPVKDGGKQYTAMLWGGGSPTQNAKAIEAFNGHARKLRPVIRFASHPGPEILAKLAALRKEPGAPNPFLEFTEERFDRYLGIMEECAKAQLARGQPQQSTMPPL